MECSRTLGGPSREVNQFTSSPVARLHGRASFDARPPIASFLHKQLPIRDAVGVADERRDRQLLRRARATEQREAGFVRQAVALADIYVLARPHEVSPSV